MDKTLYLCEKVDLEVMLDGPSLLVREKGRAYRRVPLREIGRAVIIGNVRVESAAITLLTSELVPVTFLNNKGEILAVALKYLENAPDRARYQQRFLESKDGMDRFREFAEAERKNLMLELVADIDKKVWHIFGRRGFKVKEYKSILKRRIATDDCEREMVSSIVSGLLNEMILRVIAFEGFDPHLGIINRRCNYGFCKDIFYILEAERDRQLIQFYKNKKGERITEMYGGNERLKPEIRLEIFNRFESRRQFIKVVLDRILSGIFAEARELGVFRHYKEGG